MSLQAEEVSVLHGNMIGCDFYDSTEIFLSSSSFYTLTALKSTSMQSSGSAIYIL